MDELFSLHPNGLFLRREALDHGYRDRDLTTALRARVIVRVRHGAYVPGPVWKVQDAEGRHRLLCQAVLSTHDGKVALSHSSGSLVHGLRLWKPELSRVHVVRLDNVSGRRHNDVVYHRREVRQDDVRHVHGMPVLDPTSCALGAASLTTVQRGLPILDSLLDLELADQETLWATFEQQQAWPFTRRLHVTVRLARPGAQSIGESLSRHLMWVHHLPEPELQYKVYDDAGHLVGVTDFAWPEHRLLGEFDGRIKYGRLLKPGQDPGEAVFLEKEREDLLRRITDFSMVRVIWKDIFRPQMTALQIRQKLWPLAS
jgi:hypothetical protein